MTAKIDAVEFVFLQRETGDWQCLALCARFFHPIVAAAGPILAVPDLGHDTLQADTAGMLEHFPAVDLEALAELNVGVGGEFLEIRLTLDQRQFSQIATVPIKQIESDQHDLF